MKYCDPVVEEVRKRGKEFTARFGNDPKKIMKILQKMANKDSIKQVNEIRVVIAKH